MLVALSTNASVRGRPTNSYGGFTMLSTLAAMYMPVLGEVLYWGGGGLGLILLIIIIVLLVRR
jgi:hypothetical protein